MKVIILAALSADGFIGRDATHLSTTWTTKSDKQLFMRLARESRTIAMGMSTFLTTAQKAPTVFNRSIPGRRLIVYTHHQEKLAPYPNVEATAEPPAELVKRLATEGVEQLLVSGGAQIYRQFFAAGLVDELYLSIQPLLFGAGVTLLDSSVEVNLELQGAQVEESDGTVILHYRTKKSDGES